MAPQLRNERAFDWLETHGRLAIEDPLPDGEEAARCLDARKV
jgi:hypothetical protein